MAEMGIDMVSYIMGMEDGYAAGENVVVMEEGSEYTYTDPDNDGNIVVTKEE